ncbi:MAG: ferredoxin [Peptostreptococcaceae bacterium]
MKAIVDKNTCVGCGACTGICPDVFDMDNDGLAIAIEGEISSELEEAVRDAVDTCPVCAISTNN